MLTVFLLTAFWVTVFLLTAFLIAASNGDKSESIPVNLCIPSLEQCPMNHYCYAWIEDWCKDNGWTDLFTTKKNEYWAFPPNGVMPLPIPDQALKVIKAERGLSADEKWWRLIAVISTLVAIVSSYFSQCPVPLVMAFAFCAIVVAQMEGED